MSLKRAIAGVLTIGFMIASATGLPSASYAQDVKVKTAMEILRSKANSIQPIALTRTSSLVKQ